MSARLPEQIFLKRRLRLHEESFSPSWNFQPGLTFSPVKQAEKPPVIHSDFSPGPKYELGHAHRSSCECKTLSWQTFPAQFYAFRRGWNSPRNSKKILALWGDRNFSRGWNSPCNRPLSWGKIHCHVISSFLWYKLFHGYTQVWRHQVTPTITRLVKKQSINVYGFQLISKQSVAEWSSFKFASTNMSLLS